MVDGLRRILDNLIAETAQLCVLSEGKPSQDTAPEVDAERFRLLLGIFLVVLHTGMCVILLFPKACEILGWRLRG